MKSSTLFIPAAAVFVLSCNILEPPLSLGQPRDMRQPRPSMETDYPWEVGKDTSLLVSAACFPDSYDWRRDSSYGAVACTLKLFRGVKPLLSIPAGPAERISISADRHHILGSFLYTDYSDGRGTTVKCNGGTVAQWGEPELIRGLLFKDGVLHTLGIARSDGTLTYRRDGKVVLKLDRAEAFGDFGADTYGPEGSLYEDGGRVCFGYKSVLDGMVAAYIVTDGKPEMLLSAPDIDILDVKMLSGVPAVLYNQAGVTMLSTGGGSSNVSHSGIVYWYRGGLLEYRGLTSVAGRFKAESQNLESYGLGWSDVTAILKGNISYIYCDGQNYKGIANPPDGREDCYFFHRHCACLTERGLAMALTPKDLAKPPFLVWGADTLSYRLHGYLSGVSYVVSEE